MLTFLKNAYSWLIAIGTGLQPVILLAMRLYWGWEFFTTGLGKLSDIGAISDYFQTLGIPLPMLNAYMAATTECVGGLCLLIGFASRLVAVPLATVMVVALMTAHHDALVNVFNDSTALISQTPFTFLLAAIIVFAFGPGAISVDGIIKHNIAIPKKN